MSVNLLYTNNNQAILYGTIVLVIQHARADSYILNGHLTLHGITKPVLLNAIYGGQMQDFYGQTKAGFEVTGTIRRKEFGLNWNGVTEAGGVVVSDEVKLVLNIQVIRQNLIN